MKRSNQARNKARLHKPEKQELKQPSQRLQKVMAAAGIGSRRYCEELILEGRVEVDRKVITELGVRVNPEEQEIYVDAVRLKKQKFLYYMLNKPPGVMSTNRDPAGRIRVVDLIPEDQHIFTVGRLDKSSEGLILVTNDGDLANRLAHPRYGIEKTYHVEVLGCPAFDTIKKLRQGIHLADGFCKVERIRVKRKEKKTSVLEMVLREGKNREIRRVLARVGHKVLRLRRVAIGPLRLGELPVGAHRLLKTNEIIALKKAKPAAKTPRKRRSSEDPRPTSGNTRSAKKEFSPGGSRPGDVVGRGRAGKTKASSSGRSNANAGGKTQGKFGKPSKKRAKTSTKQKKRQTVKGRR